jgi:hypothetical protein
MEMKNEGQADRQQGSRYYQSLIVAERKFDPNCMGVTDLEFVGPDLAGDGRVGFGVTCEPAGEIDLIVGDDPQRSTTLPQTLRVTAASEPGGCEPTP